MNESLHKDKKKAYRNTNRRPSHIAIKLLKGTVSLSGREHEAVIDLPNQSVSHLLITRNPVQKRVLDVCEIENERTRAGESTNHAVQAEHNIQSDIAILRSTITFSRTVDEAEIAATSLAHLWDTGIFA